jgi:predicted membrane protein
MEGRTLSLVLAFVLAVVVFVIGAAFAADAYSLQALNQTQGAETIGSLGGILMIIGGSAGLICANRVGHPPPGKQAEF